MNINIQKVLEHSLKNHMAVLFHCQTITVLTIKTKSPLNLYSFE